MSLAGIVLLVGLMAGIANIDTLESNEHEHMSTTDTKNAQTHIYNRHLREFKKVSIDRLMDEEILNEHSIQEALTNVNTRKYMLILLDGIVYDDDENLEPLIRKIFLDWNILDKTPLIDCLNDSEAVYYTLELINNLMFCGGNEFFVLSAKILCDEKIFSRDFIRECLNNKNKKIAVVMLDIMNNFTLFDYVE